MEYSYDIGEEAALFFIVIVAIGLFFVSAFYFNVVIPFIKERASIKVEMQRSDNEEYDYWKRELRRLYLSYIPIIGRLFR